MPRLPTFDQVHTVCLFIGYPRSGHSLYGALLDAHPNVALSHQLHLLELIQDGVVDQNEIFQRIIDNTVSHAAEGRKNAGYNYEVPGQWQGKWDNLLVIGDKSGGKTALLLADHPGVLTLAGGVIQHPIKWLHIIRNPFDCITTSVQLKMKRTPNADMAQVFQDKADRFFKQADTVHRFRPSLADALLDVYHEAFVGAPKQGLRRICEHLGLVAKEDYLEAACHIVFDKPKKSRETVDWWTEQRIDYVHTEMRKFSFFAPYHFTA